MKKIKKKCLQCKQPFEASVSEHNRGYAKFCSLSCSTTHQRANEPKPKPNYTCHQCGSKFYRSPSKKKTQSLGYTSAPVNAKTGHNELTEHHKYNLHTTATLAENITTENLLSENCLTNAIVVDTKSTLKSLSPIT